MAESEYDTKMQTIEFNIEDSELEELKEAARFLQILQEFPTSKRSVGGGMNCPRLHSVFLFFA